jgi:hypothetical protein
MADCGVLVSEPAAPLMLGTARRARERARIAATGTLLMGDELIILAGGLFWAPVRGN